MPVAANGGVLRGEVVNKSDGEALPGVAVVLSGDNVTNAKSLVAKSDRDGLYEIVEIPHGIYDITYSLIGFKSVSIPDIAISEFDTLILNTDLTHIIKLQVLDNDGIWSDLVSDIIPASN